MPSTSESQHRFMQLSASDKGRAWLRAHGKEPAPKKVALEFLEADKEKLRKGRER